MSNLEPLNFPESIYLADYSGNFSLYFKEVYSIFKDHFITNKPFYKGAKVGTKRFPEVDGVHRTFYHITHEGENEHDRIPDLNRMERIRFPKFIIDNCPHDELLIWVKQIRKENRIHILNEDERYLLVLNERDGYYLLWTAFYIEHSHTLRKKKKEYIDYINAETA
ncbi:hypothetical protein [Chryseobacterium herbae]|uniref:Phage P1-related protein n=1 Tax=Chryseobacterium herbae TaxID=2976476 RepID=A0ABT2IWT0_9FLAO|nr:hypothetical protein [Chryseobacterium sp. pc1-10]MCT2563293.1 hypothetical protein [Chryseobacterium sp. pc1-10]